MKKLIVWTVAIVAAIAIGVALAQIGHAQTWYPANQKTIAWDGVTKLANGDPLPAGLTVQYRIYTALAADATKANPVEKGVTVETSYVLTLSQEGKYFVGVKAERVVAGAVVSVSGISWSDSGEAVPNGQTWGIEYYLPPAGAGNLRTQ